jgi:hypothetical protein
VLVIRRSVVKCQGCKDKHSHKKEPTILLYSGLFHPYVLKYLSKIHFNIILPSTLKYTKWAYGLLMGITTKMNRVFYISLMSLQRHSASCDDASSDWRRPQVQVVKPFTPCLLTVTFEVLKAVKIRMSFFWAVNPCRLVWYI